MHRDRRSGRADGALLRWLIGSLVAAWAALTPAFAGDGPVFDSVTGYRIARYRAPVHEAPPGGQRISIDDLDRLIASGAALLDVMPTEGGGPEPDTGEWRVARQRDNIPGSVWLADVGRGALSREMESYFRDGLEKLSAGDTNHPIVVYCQSDCWMAWNAVKRASSYGYARLYWYPEGADGWRDHDRPVARARPAPLPRRPATGGIEMRDVPTEAK